MKTTHTFHVRGMHCTSCVALTESELLDVPGVSSAKASLVEESVTVIYDADGASKEELMKKLSAVLEPHGYSLSLSKEGASPRWGDFKIALPAALAFIALFIALQKLGLVNLITGSNVTYGTAFVIGLVASVSTCMAMVGGLVLSVSANFAKEGNRIRPQAFFHIGRIASFFLLGGLVGALGSAVRLDGTGTAVLSLVVALVLLVLGINLLDVFPWTKRIQPTLPAFLGKRVHNLKEINHVLTPLLLGTATFFLPCGFTQSMQLYALSTGSFWTGALIMLSFALGTLPVLALLSFGSAGLKDKAQSGVFFKAAGLVVLFFGVFNLINSLVIMGIIPPVFNF